MIRTTGVTARATVKVMSLQTPFPTHCDYCHQELKDFVVDGATPWGQWGNFCLACTKRLTIKLGVGRGQKFSLTTGQKVEG